MHIRGLFIAPSGDIFVRPPRPLLEPLYWLRLYRVGPKRRRIARELRRLDPCLSPGLAQRLLEFAEEHVQDQPVYIAGALSEREAVDAAIRLSRAGARVKVVETPIA